MTITNQIIDIRRGDSYSISVALTNADGGIFNTAEPGITMKWTLATSSNGEALVTKTLEDGLTLETGGVVIALTAEDTDLVPKLYYHELKVFDGDDVATTMVGTVVVRRTLVVPDVPAP